MIGDDARLANCRVRVDPRDLRLPPRLHHRCSLFRRVRPGRLHRHAARPAAAAGRLGLAVRARLRPGGRAARRRDPRERLRGPRPAAAAHDRAAGRRRRRRRARRAARRHARARDRLDRRRRGGADGRAEPAARRHPAVGDPAQTERGDAALGRDPRSARAARPASVDHRSLARRGAARDAASRATPACATPRTAWCA